MRSNCRRAKKIILLAIILSAVQLLIFAGTSFSTIVGSKHDLSFLTGGAGQFMSNNEDQVCIFCHTPHQAIATDGYGNNLPLWNRSISQADFTLYSSPTFDAGSSGEDTQTQPRSMTLLCLSCHDGTSALNVLENYGNNNPINMVGGYDQIEDIWTPSFPGYPGANIGESANKDLSNDHPVSFVYDSGLVTADGHLHPPDSISPLKLYNSKLECATCHNVHEEGDPVVGTSPFLRMANSNSEMCLKCHIK